MTAWVEGKSTLVVDDGAVDPEQRASEYRSRGSADLHGPVRRDPPVRVLTFLDDDTLLADELALTATLPPGPFLRALLRRMRRAPIRAVTEDICPQGRGGPSSMSATAVRVRTHVRSRPRRWQ
jgi:hypothetical protein